MTSHGTANRASRGLGPLALSLLLLLPASLLGSAADAGAQATSEAAAGGSGSLPAAAETITAAELESHVRTLAHDSMRGRDTPSPELEQAARYVADRLRSFGVRPAVSDSFLQWYSLTTIEQGEDEEQEAVLSGPEGERTLELGSEFVPLGVGPDARAEGPIRLVRSLVSPGPAGGDVLAVPSGPNELSSTLSKVRTALDSSGAAGALVAVDADEEMFRRLSRFFAGERTDLGEPDSLATPVVLARRDALPEALDHSLTSGIAVPSGWSAELRSSARIRTQRAMNTVGWIRGSDPELREEYVVFTAHMDHVGVGPAVDGDSIYNGADDDGSGVATILEVAEAFADAGDVPRRSVVFMTVSGEEKGLLGSRWYAENPVFPLDETVANLNMDMIGRNWRDSVAAIGLEHSTLGATTRQVAEDHPGLGIEVVGDRWPEERLFYRSDHYNFARRGVPALFYFSGLHDDYHEPSDEAGRVDYRKTARIARLIYLTGLRVADADERPSWDPDARRRIVGDGS